MLCQHLWHAAGKFSLQTILLEVVGTIYSPYNLELLRTLGLDPEKGTKLALKLHAHRFQYNTDALQEKNYQLEVD